MTAVDRVHSGVHGTNGCLHFTCHKFNKSGFTATALTSCSRTSIRDRDQEAGVGFLRYVSFPQDDRSIAVSTNKAFVRDKLDQLQPFPEGYSSYLPLNSRLWSTFTWLFFFFLLLCTMHMGAPPFSHRPRLFTT